MVINNYVKNKILQKIIKKVKEIYLRNMFK